MPKGNSKVPSTRKKSTHKKDKIPITFNEEQLKRIEGYMGILGNTRAEIIRNIVINWLLDKSGGRR